ncbi:MAG: tRNA (guanosine(37)-N1)-methyltransferase TrmD [Cytophagales bacterium]|nr:tRNA (guanosine(37)-N1)-methyltransferase TrmD [Cytophagales bacterium]
MNIDIITIFPEVVKNFFSFSIMQRAQNFGKVNINVHNLRDYSLNKHHKTDDYAYGGGAGLVMTVEPIERCITALKNNRDYDDIIYMCPDGEVLTQSIVNEFSLKENLVILCGHYKGVDERVREHLVSRELSIGEYVVSGGELPACLFVDAITRLIPGVLNDASSALEDSFQNDSLIAPPVYTRPEKYKNWIVPSILLSGDKKKIDEWNLNQAIIRTNNFNKLNKKKIN